MGLQLESSAFEAGQTIPRTYSGEGADRSPPLSWRGAPDATQAYALIVDDPDAPSGTFVHWVAFNIPAKDRGLPEGIQHRGDLTEGVLQGRNDFGQIGYNGPKPPSGKAHHYHFKLYALAERLELEPGASKQDVERAMRGRVLDQAELTALYQKS